VERGPKLRCRQKRALSSLSASRVTQFFGRNPATAACSVPTPTLNAPLFSFGKIAAVSAEQCGQEPFRGVAAGLIA